jgi:choline dehydrogenase-like flavoprotein
MLFDFNEAWPRVTEAQYDVCVCGTGPAGIPIARKLAARGKKVLLLEGGGLTYSEESQRHYRGSSVGRPIYLEGIRLRYLGGTSNHWTGLCALLDPITFEAHDGPGLPGWPISREQVLSELNEATEILDIAGTDLAPSKQPGFVSPWFDRYSVAYSPPTRFFEKYGAELRQSRQIDVFYNANLTDLRLNDNLARVKSVAVQNYNGQISDVSATQYVLALGGIENVRILLNANRQVPAGIGNHSGMVGRCFMESLNVPIGRFLVTDPKFWKTAVSDEAIRSQGRREAGEVSLVPTEALMRQNGIENGAIHFDANIPTSIALREFGRLRVLKEFIHQTGCSWSTLTELARQIVDFNCPGDGVIQSIIEQKPNPDSRVSLTDDVDSFGLRRVQVNWQLTGADLKTIRVISIESAKEMARLNCARVQLAPFILDTNLNIPVSGFGHHMGTTRMSADPHYGVVDENCRVHGIQNLYLAGSSVFSTCGGRNPTMTIVLLALRLGEFLSKAS